MEMQINEGEKTEEEEEVVVAEQEEKKVVEEEKVSRGARNRLQQQ